MKPKLGQLFSCIAVLVLLLSGCAGGQKERRPEISVLLNSETTQAADGDSVSDIGSKTEKESSASRGTSFDFPDNTDSSKVQHTQPPAESNLPAQQPEENTVKKMKLEIGNNRFTATLENNAAVDALVEMLREAPVVIQMSDYSGFEKVGALGTSLPTSNSQTTTQPGDIVLYNGNQIVVFYGSNSWSYTRLGKIDDLSGWKDALGSGSVTVTFSLKEE